MTVAWLIVFVFFGDINRPDWKAWLLSLVACMFVDLLGRLPKRG